MGSVAHVLFLLLILILIFVFSNFHLMSRTWDLKQNSSIQVAADHSLLELNWVREDGDGNGEGEEAQIKKVSGEDATGEETMLVLERFVRVLLGLKSSNKRPVKSHEESSLSPAPAPPYGAATPAPAPSRSIHAHPHVSHSPHLSMNLPHLHNPPVASRRQVKARVSRRIVIAVAVSAGAAILIVLLILVLICWRPQKSRKKILRRMRLASGTGYSLGRSSKLVNSHNSVNKVSFDPVPEFFYQNSVGLFPDQASCLKQTYETAHINESSNKTTMNSALQEGTYSGEPNRCESAGESCSSVHRINPHESLSSDDDESFHSVRNSHSTSSPSYVSKGSPSPDHNMFKDPTLSSPMNPPTPPMTPDSVPLYPLNLISPSSSPYSSKQTTEACTSSSQKRISLDSPLSSSSQCAIPTPPHNRASIPATAKPDLAAGLGSSVQASPSHPLFCSRQLPSVAPCLTSNSRNSDSMSTCLNLDTPSSSMETLPPPPPPPPPPPLHCQPSLPPIQSKSLPKTLHKTPPLPPPPPQPSVIQSVSPRGSIPHPPCPPLPPPFQKGHSSKQQPPPPPPFQGQQLTALGKDGAPLPKLKPLHWDKVRATPDRSMVWDKLRSSSFE